MDNRKTLKVKIAAIGSGKYSIAIVAPENIYVNPESVRKLLFSWDEASFYGTRLTVDTIDTIPVFIVNAWVLLNLFAKEGFNSFIDWEWSELSSLCLSAAPVLHEAIEKGVPVPDFTSLQNEQIGWTLPEEVLEEFVPAFWGRKSLHRYSR